MGATRLGHKTVSICLLIKLGTACDSARAWDSVRKKLVQQTWVPQTLHSPKKGCVWAVSWPASGL